MMKMNSVFFENVERAFTLCMGLTIFISLIVAILRTNRLILTTAGPSVF